MKTSLLCASLMLAIFACSWAPQAPIPYERRTDCDLTSRYQVRPDGPRTERGQLEFPGCDQYPLLTIHSDSSASPLTNYDGQFRAGFGRFRFTPDTGLGMLGWGTEAGIAHGFRDSLLARAMVLQGTNGEYLAVATLDLNAVSMILHRRVAEAVHRGTGGALGADRIMLVATHTHSGPGNIMSSWPQNEFGSNTPGYDSALVEHIAAAASTAIVVAFHDREIARARWNEKPVWGHTRNRALEAFNTNRSVRFPVPQPPASVSDSGRAVNPVWSQLTVEKRDGNRWVPAGTFNLFSIHATVMPAGDTLYSADVQGAVTTLLDSELGGINLMANGTEGDVSPEWEDASRCVLREQRVIARPEGPRTARPLVDFDENEDVLRNNCDVVAAGYLATLSRALADEAMALNRESHSQMENGATSAPEVRRNFEVIDLTSREARRGGLCARPQLGTAFAAGGHDGPTRIKGWRVLGLWPIGIDWGDDAKSGDSLHCQYPKKVLLDLLQASPVASHQFPEFAQLAVAQIGDRVIGFLPAEPTTIAGRIFMASMRMARHPDPSAWAPDDWRRYLIVGLANGYINYLTTWDEYQRQGYEGGATMYGPHSTEFFAEALNRLVKDLPAAGALPVPDVEVRPGPGPD